MRSIKEPGPAAEPAADENPLAGGAALRGTVPVLPAAAVATLVAGARPDRRAPAERACSAVAPHVGQAAPGEPKPNSHRR